MILTIIIPSIMAALNFGVAVTFLIQKRYDWATVYFSYCMATIALIFCARSN